jgi:hypothetical protein
MLGSLTLDYLKLFFKKDIDFRRNFGIIKVQRKRDIYMITMTKSYTLTVEYQLDEEYLGEIRDEWIEEATNEEIFDDLMNDFTVSQYIEDDILTMLSQVQAGVIARTLTIEEKGE